MVGIHSIIFDTNIDEIILDINTLQSRRNLGITGSVVYGHQLSNSNVQNLDSSQTAHSVLLDFYINNVHHQIQVPWHHVKYIRHK